MRDEQKHRIRRAARERIATLRKRFPELRHPSEMDHDQTVITSTKHRLFPMRTFFLGEVWSVWIATHDSRQPGLVTRKQPDAFAAVEMAPSASPRGLDQAGLVFEPDTTGTDLQTGARFRLSYRRPVPRASISSPMGALQSSEKQRLARLLVSLQQQAPPL